MFDPVGAFTKQFTPVDGGYLYYPSLKSGAKLVTAEEFHALVNGWQRVAGRGGRWKFVGVVSLSILAWTIVSIMFVLPNWTGGVFSAAIAIAISAWITLVELRSLAFGKRQASGRTRPTHCVSSARSSSRVKLAIRPICLDYQRIDIFFYPDISQSHPYFMGLDHRKRGNVCIVPLD